MSVETDERLTITSRELYGDVEKLMPYIRQTPVRQLEPHLIGSGNLLLGKFETEQASGTFKERGAFLHMLHLLGNGTRLTYARSAGNHAAAVARAANVLGMQTTVFVPENIAEARFKTIQRLGQDNVTIVKTGQTYDDTCELAQLYAATSSAVEVPAFDDPYTIRGQRTMTTEALSQTTPVDKVFISVGGGGQAAGTAEALSVLSPQTTLVLVELAGNDSLSRSLAAGRRVKASHPNPLCEGSAVELVGELPFQKLMAYRGQVEFVTIDAADIGSCIVDEDDTRLTQSLAMGVDAWDNFPETTGVIGWAGARKYARTRPDQKNQTWLTYLTGANSDPERLDTAVDAWNHKKNTQIGLGTTSVWGGWRSVQK